MLTILASSSSQDGTLATKQADITYPKTEGFKNGYVTYVAPNLLETRRYNPQTVSNTFAVGERIEWMSSVSGGTNKYAPHVNATAVVYDGGIITKITRAMVFLDMDYGNDDYVEMRHDKMMLENRASDERLKAAIRASLEEQVKIKEQSQIPANSTPHDVYALIDPQTHEVQYVGITKNAQRRYVQHCQCQGLNLELNIWIQELLRSNLIPHMTIIEKVNGSNLAQQRETYWIQHHLTTNPALKNIAKVERETRS